MSSSLGSPSQTAAFKNQVRRHCEQAIAETLTTSPSRSIPIPGPRFKLHEQGAGGSGSPVVDELRRSSDGQVPPMISRKDHPFVGSPPPVFGSRHVHTKNKGGKLKAQVSEIRRSSDGQLHPNFPVDPFVGPPPAMIPQHIIKPHRGTDPKFNAELRRSSDGQLQPVFASNQDPFVGPRPLMIPKHIQQQSGNAEVQVSPTEFRIDMDVAAYAPEELDVKIVGDHVVIRGKHAEGSPGEKAKISQEFCRRYALPEDVIVDDVSVLLAKSGKLSVKVPRRMAAEEKHTVQRKCKVKFQE